MTVSDLDRLRHLERERTFRLPDVAMPPVRETLGNDLPDSLVQPDDPLDMVRWRCDDCGSVLRLPEWVDGGEPGFCTSCLSVVTRTRVSA